MLFLDFYILSLYLLLFTYFFIFAFMENISSYIFHLFIYIDFYLFYDFPMVSYKKSTQLNFNHNTTSSILYQFK